MNRQRVGQLIFVSAWLLALVVYGLTAPAGLPWNDSTYLAEAYLGEIVRLPVQPHPVWGIYVRVFGGAVALSAFMAALAAGLLAAVVNRHTGWRLAAAAAIVWIFAPAVWNRAIAGERDICLVAMAVAAVWLGNAGWCCCWRLVRAKWSTLSAPMLKRTAFPRLRFRSQYHFGGVALALSVLWALVSLTRHDYRLGEGASVFARGVIEEAAGRVVVANGACDGQLARLLKASADESGMNAQLIQLRHDECYRTNLLEWARAAFPTATNLWVAAQVGPQAFADEAAKRHPEAFYLMSGKSATLAGWSRRWQDFGPYLDSIDPFVALARRQFAYEANAIGNRLAGERYTESGEDGRELAWQLYWRIYQEVDPGNISALINLREMVGGGYGASVDERHRIDLALEKFFQTERHRRELRQLVRVAGPIRSDPVALSQLAAEAKRRVAARVAAGESVPASSEMLTLGEWNNEMVMAMDRGETVSAGRIARAILANPKWRGFVPANAVLGAIARGEGDYAAGESFFRMALAATNRVPAVVLNDFADTLMHLHKLDEAERIARRAIAETNARFWLARLTLAQILEAKLRAQGEVEAVRRELEQLLAALVRDASVEGRQKALDLQRRIGRK